DKGFASALLSLLEAIQPQKGNAQKEAAGERSLIQFQPAADYDLCFVRLNLLEKKHSQRKLRPGVASAAQIDCFLEGLHGLLIASQPHLRHARMVVGF